MKLELELTPEQEARVRAEAERSGKSIREYALDRVLDASSEPSDPFAGLFEDDPELVDALQRELAKMRETDGLRTCDE